MDYRRKVGYGAGLLSVGLILGLVCSMTELSHTSDSLLSFLSGMGVGMGCALIISGWSDKRRG
jgi:hypothetical protein